MEITINYKPIGILKTPFNTTVGMPIQPTESNVSVGMIILDEPLVEGLVDLDGFSHITLLYHLHEVSDYKLTVIPFIDNKPHGIFATRAPVRPNAIGISTVKLLSISGNVLHIEGVDMLNDTPLLDIKPFYPQYDNRLNTRSGWLEAIDSNEFKNIKSDNRFNK